MKIIQMMGPNHPKGGEWAQEIALGVVRLQVKILGTVISLLNRSFCGMFLFSAIPPSSLAPALAKAVVRNCRILLSCFYIWHKHCFCYSVQSRHVFIVIKYTYKIHHCSDVWVCHSAAQVSPVSFSCHLLLSLTLYYCEEMS